MKLSDIFNTVMESFDSEYPIYKRSNSLYDIDADGTIIRVILNGLLVDNLNILSVKFVNPDSENAMDSTNLHGNNALKIFSTIIKLIDPIKFNILFCVADDSNVEIEGKKHDLYKSIFTKLQRLGKIHSVRSMQLDEYTKPIIVAERKVSLDDSQLKQYIIKFAKNITMG